MELTTIVPQLSEAGSGIRTHALETERADRIARDPQIINQFINQYLQQSDSETSGGKILISGIQSFANEKLGSPSELARMPVVHERPHGRNWLKRPTSHCAVLDAAAGGRRRKTHYYDNDKRLRGMGDPMAGRVGPTRARLCTAAG
jgi:hypothetical protein